MIFQTSITQLLCSMLIFRGVPPFPTARCFFFSVRRWCTWSLPLGPSAKGGLEVITSSHKRSWKFPFLIFVMNFFLGRDFGEMSQKLPWLVYKKRQGMESSRFLSVNEVGLWSQVHLHRKIYTIQVHSLPKGPVINLCWWFQPIWKIWSSNWESIPQIGI